jgi:cbb3-type cytochrome oxidase cytochrome c subunit
MRPGLPGLLLLALLPLIVSCIQPEGAEIFTREGCILCHRHGGIGHGTVDLTNVTERRSEAWIRDQIHDARLHSPDSGMPSFAHLSPQEVDALIRFLRKGPRG